MNLEILNEQLIAKGYPPMNGLNGHEVRNLPDGNIVMIGQRIVVSTNAQGGTPAKPINIIGDEVVVPGPQSSGGVGMDAFAHQDVNRQPLISQAIYVLVEADAPSPLQGTTGCIRNAVQVIISHGNIILSNVTRTWS